MFVIPNRIWFVGSLFVITSTIISWYHMGKYGCTPESYPNHLSQPGMYMINFKDINSYRFGPDCGQKMSFLFPLLFSFLAITVKSSFLVFAAAVFCGTERFGLTFYFFNSVFVMLLNPSLVSVSSGTSESFINEVAVAGLLGWMGQFLCVSGASLYIHGNIETNNFLEEKSYNWIRGKWFSLIVTVIAVVSIVINTKIDDETSNSYMLYNIYAFNGTVLQALLCYLIGYHSNCYKLFHITGYCVMNIASISLRVEFLDFLDIRSIVGISFIYLFIFLVCIAIVINNEMLANNIDLSVKNLLVIISGVILHIVSLSINCCSEIVVFCSLVLAVFTVFFKSHFSLCISIGTIFMKYNFENLLGNTDKASTFLSAGVIARVGHVVGLLGSSMCICESNQFSVGKYMRWIKTSSLQLLIKISVIFAIIALGLEFNVTNDKNDILFSLATFVSEEMLIAIVLCVAGYYFKFETLQLGSAYFAINRLASTLFFYDNIITYDLSSRKSYMVFLNGYIFSVAASTLIICIGFFNSKEPRIFESSSEDILLKEMVPNVTIV